MRTRTTLVVFLAAFCGLVSSATAFPAVPRPYSFAAGIDPSCQLTGGEGSWDNIVADTGGTVSVETQNVGSGYCAAKFQTPAGSAQSRAEVSHNSIPAPVTLNYEWLEYVPSNPSIDHGVLQQTKQGGSGGGCYNGGLQLPKEFPGHLGWATVASCSSGSIKHDLGPVPYDRWFGVHVLSTFSDQGHALIQIDPDGYGPLPYVTKLDTDADTLSGSGIKLRLGLYHDEDPHISYVFGDAFHVAG